MEFVLRGINPKLKNYFPEETYYSEYEKYIKKGVGIYFRTDIFRWYPIWNTVVKFCYPSILSDEEADNGYYDKGQVIGEEKALAIAKALERKILNGEVAMHFKELKDAITKVPPTFCSNCNGSGVQEHKIKDGRRSVNRPYLLDSTNSNRFFIKCGKCDGSGYFLNDMCIHHKYDISLLLEFLIFCQHSGGLSIQ